MVLGYQFHISKIISYIYIYKKRYLYRGNVSSFDSIAWSLDINFIYLKLSHIYKKRYLYRGNVSSFDSYAWSLDINFIYLKLSHIYIYIKKDIFTGAM